MELTYQREMQLPACCCAVSEEEMTYLQGGAYSFDVFGYTVTFHDERLYDFTINLVSNIAYVLGMGITGAALDGVIKGYKDGLSIGQTFQHYWGRQNTFGKWATVLVGVPLAGYYAVNETIMLIATAIQIYNSAVDLVNYLCDVVPKAIDTVSSLT